MGQIIEFNNRGLRHTIEKNSRIVNLLIVNYIVNFERQYVAKRSCQNVQYLLKDRENKHRIQISGTYAAGRIIVHFNLVADRKSFTSFCCNVALVFEYDGGDRIIHKTSQYILRKSRQILVQSNERVCPCHTLLFMHLYSFQRLRIY